MAVKTIMPITMVSPIAISGLASSISVLGSWRRRHSSMCRLRAVDAAHHQADLVDAEAGDGARRREPPLVDDAEPVGELEQFIEVLRDHDHGRALGCEIDQFLPDRGGGTGIDPPGRLRDDKNGRLLANLA